ncbi:MAG: hypothetical protein ACLQBK_01860 [Candidatus Sulfotelmatobacter sp.]
MTPDKQGRVATAAGFLAGMLAGLDALRDAKVLWPPAIVWEELRHPQRLELGAGIALIVVTLIIAAVRRQT